MTLWDRFTEILGCVVDELVDIGSPVPSHISVQPGAVAWDDCCDGQLWVRVVRAHPTSTFPNKTLEVRPCGLEVATQIGVGIIRCSTGLEALQWAEDPTAAALTADAQQQVCDMGAIYRALACCLDWSDGDVIVDQYAPLGPQGGCYGGEWLAWLDAELACPIPVGSPGGS